MTGKSQSQEISKPPVEAVLLDYGGVLSRKGRANTLVNLVANTAKIPIEEVHPSVADLHNKYRVAAISSTEFFDSLSALYPDSMPITEDYYLASAGYIHDKAVEVYAMADELSFNGIRTAILSNVYCVSAKALKTLGNYDGFDPVILSCDEGLAKPDPKFFELAVERVGVEPEKIVFVDDQEKNLGPAQQLGMETVRSDSPEQVVRDLGRIMLERNGLKLAA